MSTVHYSWHRQRVIASCVQAHVNMTRKSATFQYASGKSLFNGPRVAGAQLKQTPGNEVCPAPTLTTITSVQIFSSMKRIE